jgi:Fe-S cluster assembly protein SufD
VVKRPIELLFLATQPGVVESPRALIVVGRTAQARLVENYAATGEQGYFRNAATELVLGDGAIAELCRVQNESHTAHHVASTASHQGRDSRLATTYVVLGSRLARHDIRAVLAGEGAECDIRGFYLLNGQQHVDHHTVIDHASPHCNSKEYLNGVLDDESRAVFTGRIVVREGAQKTDSKQSNNNVLLSETARADSQPQLEIYADDVRCTHGATLGPLSEDATLYFRSRGIAEEEARKMLTYGFGTEIFERIGIDDVREKLERIIRGRLGIGV